MIKLKKDESVGKPLTASDTLPTSPSYTVLPVSTSPTRGSPTGGSPTGGSPTGGSPTGGSPTRGSPNTVSPTNSVAIDRAFSEDEDAVKTGQSKGRRSADNAPEEATLIQIKSRARKQARGRSLLMFLFIVFDLLYCLTRFILLAPGIHIENAKYWKPLAILCTLGGPPEAPVLIDWPRAWMGFVSWIAYLVAILVLIIGVVTKKLMFFYANVSLKVGSMLLGFLGMIIYGFDCNSKTIVLEVTLFLLFHIPFQIVGVKLCTKLIQALKKAKRGGLVVGRASQWVDLDERASANSTDIMNKSMGRRTLRANSTGTGLTASRRYYTT